MAHLPPPAPRRGPPLIPTNSVTTKDGITVRLEALYGESVFADAFSPQVRARIDPTLVSVVPALRRDLIFSFLGRTRRDQATMYEPQDPGEPAALRASGRGG